MPRISVIIPSWNSRPMTATCLDNLRHQRFTDYEVLLVENGSTDDTLEYLRKHYQDYPNLTILPQSRNLGFDGGCNAGIRAAKGEFFALLNSDAAPQPDWLELLVKRMDTSTQIAIVQPKVLQTRTASDGSHLIDTTGDFYHIWGLPHPRGRDEADHGQYDQPEQIFAANAAAALYRASVFAQVGAFDEEYFLYYEDVDISFRARLAGYEVWYEPAAVVYHEVGGTSGGHETNPLTRYHMPKNLWYLYLCDMPARLFWRYLWRFAFFQTLSWANSFRSGGWRLGWPHTKSIVRAIIMTPRMFRRRLSIQRRRTVSTADIDRLLLKTVPAGVGPAFRKMFPWLVRDL